MSEIESKQMNHYTLNDVREFCINYINTHTNNSRLSSVLKNNGMYEFVDNYESNKIKDYPFIYKIFWLINDIHDFSLCETCGKTITKKIGDLWELTTKPRRFCCLKCLSKSNLVKEKRKTTSIEKYGVDNIFKSKSFKDTLLKTNKDAYGSKSKNTYSSYQKMLESIYDTPLFTLEEYDNRSSKHDILSFKCKKCSNTFQAKHIDGYHLRCPVCYPQESTSKCEKDIFAFIKTIYKNEIVENTKNIIAPYELDIYIPEKKLAFEFDGLYWHSDIYKSKNYHLTKTEMCEKQGIHLIHIFENEWINKQDIVKSRIKNLLGVYDHIVYARKCVIKEIDYKMSCDFLDENHIQGKCVSGINVGLFYNNELASVMTFGKSRFSKKYNFELLRFCNKLGYHIPGSASKLLNYFEIKYKPSSLVSYADRRWSIGNLYSKLNFVKVNSSNPNYWYFYQTNPNKIIESRVKYQKHKLKDILKDFDDSLTEVKNMKNNGYLRIFDCGNLVFEKIY